MAYTNIDDPSAYFQTALYTGAGSTVVTVTNDGNSDLQPDFLWFKRRDSAVSHVLLDTNRGANVTSGFGPTGYSFALNSNARDSEVADSTGVMTITSDGFTVKELTYASGSTNTGSMVAWQWHCNGGTNSSNTDGSITSTVQVNQDAGFSIQTFTGASSGNSNWGHGLGVTPDVFILKRRDGISGWWGHWKGTARTAGGGNNWEYMGLHSTVAATPLSTFKADSTTITTSDDFVVPSASYLCYAFAEKQGYSKFGSYVGNGSPNGPFVYTGFKPAFVMVKKSNNTGSWVINDSKRIGYNPNNYDLYANLTDSEEDNDRFDLLSNGFKARSTSSPSNASGDTYIYMAFAESPFTTSTGIPTTAR